MIIARYLDLSGGAAIIVSVIQDLAVTIRTLSYGFWQKANEYLSERIGNLLYPMGEMSKLLGQQVAEMSCKAILTTAVTSPSPLKK